MVGLDDELLARYLAGEAGPDELARVEAWARDPAAASELARLKQLWSERPAPGVWNVDAAWQRVNHLIATAEAAPPAPNRRWLVYAAAAAVLLAAAALVVRPARGPSIYATEAGNQRILELSDGSRIVLAPASRLTVVPTFDAGVREVTLEGRAWFDVPYLAHRPFRVRTEVAVIENLGTAFEVRAPPGEDVLVAVVEGAVAVHIPAVNAGEPMKLGPRDVARVPREGTPVVRHDAPVEGLVGWRSGILRFEREPVDEVLRELERWYAVRFVLDSSAAGDRMLSADFPTANLDETLAILSAALALEARRSNGVVTLSPRTAR